MLRKTVSQGFPALVRCGIALELGWWKDGARMRPSLSCLMSAISNRCRFTRPEA